MAHLARVEAVTGQEAAAEAHAVQAMAVAGETETETTAAISRGAIALARLAVGCFADALEAVRELPELIVARDMPEPSVLLVAGDVIEAHVKAGELARAERLVEELVERTGTDGAGPRASPPGCAASSLTTNARPSFTSLGR